MDDSLKNACQNGHLQIQALRWMVGQHERAFLNGGPAGKLAVEESEADGRARNTSEDWSLLLQT